MAVSMIGPKFYAWDRNGKPLAFGKLYTYQARTNAPKPTYQSEDQQVENTNPVILNGEGYADIYLDGSYKMVLKDSNDNEIWSSDPVTSAQATEWVNCAPATYVSPTEFHVAGNVTEIYEPGRSVRLSQQSVNYTYTTVLVSSYAGGFTKVTVTQGVVQTNIEESCVSIVGSSSIQIGAYTNFIFPSVDNMLIGKSISGVVDIVEGSVLETLSHNAPVNSKWVCVATLDSGDYGVQLDNGLYAKLVSTDGDIRHYGAYGDGTEDDLQAFQSALSSDIERILIPKGVFRISGRATIDREVTIQGYGFDSKVGYDGTLDRAFDITSSNVTIDSCRIESLDRMSERSVDEALIYVVEGVENITIKGCHLGFIRQYTDDGYGYVVLVQGQNVDNLNICDNAFESARANEDGVTGLDGFCGFIYIYHADTTSFDRGVSGFICRNRFYNTESIPVTSVLRSDADAIRLFNGWTAATDDYATPDKTNSYNIVISDNVFELIQHICIKASGVGGLIVNNNRLDNTQEDRYPGIDNGLGTTGEKDWQFGFEFRGGSFVCDGNFIQTQSGCIAVNGVLDKPGYAGIVSNNITKHMPQTRSGVSAISGNMDNITIQGNVMEGASKTHERVLSMVFTNTYHPRATKIRNAVVSDNVIVKGEALFVDVDDSNVSNLNVNDGKFSFRRVNRCKFNEVNAVDDTLPFNPDAAANNESFDNEWNDCLFEARLLVSTASFRPVQVPANMNNNRFNGLTVVVGETPASGSSCFMLQCSAENCFFENVHLKYDGENGSYFDAYCRFYNDSHIGKLTVDVNKVAANDNSPLEVHSSGLSVVVETLLARFITANVRNYGIDTRFINTIGNFSINNISGGTHTLVNNIPLS